MLTNDVVSFEQPGPVLHTKNSEARNTQCFTIFSVKQLRVYRKKCFMLRIVSGRVAQSVGHLFGKSEILGSITGLAAYFRFSFR